MTPKEAFKAIPFNDDADEPQTWRGIALSAISDMYHYAEDADPARRYVSANAYAEDAVRLAAQQDRVREALGAWFNSLPCDSIGKEHFDRLCQIVGIEQGGKS